MSKDWALDESVKWAKIAGYLEGTVEVAILYLETGKKVEDVVLLLKKALKEVKRREDETDE